MTEPTDAEIDVMVAAYLGDCGPQATRVYSYTRAVLATWGQPVAQQGMAYAAMPEPFIGVQDRPWGGHAEVIRSAIGEESVVSCFNPDQMRAFADATHALRASRGQAPAQAAPAAVAGTHEAGGQQAMSDPCQNGCEEKP